MLASPPSSFSTRPRSSILSSFPRPTYDFPSPPLLLSAVFGDSLLPRHLVLPFHQNLAPRLSRLSPGFAGTGSSLSLPSLRLAFPSSFPCSCALFLFAAGQSPPSPFSSSTFHPYLVPAQGSSVSFDHLPPSLPLSPSFGSSSRSPLPAPLFVPALLLAPSCVSTPSHPVSFSIASISSLLFGNPVLRIPLALVFLCASLRLFSLSSSSSGRSVPTSSSFSSSLILICCLASSSHSFHSPPHSGSLPAPLTSFHSPSTVRYSLSLSLFLSTLTPKYSPCYEPGQRTLPSPLLLLLLLSFDLRILSFLLVRLPLPPLPSTL